MNMVIRERDDAGAWEEFNKRQAYSLFTQSAHYADFYRALGEEAFILTAEENGEIQGGMLIVTVHAKRGRYLYVPYGPIITGGKEDVWRALFCAAAARGRAGRYDCVRVSPFLSDSLAERQKFRVFGYRPAPMHALAERTIMLELAHPEEAIFSAMNKNHRNLIRRCEREGVRIVQTIEREAVNRFNALLEDTTRRHRFHRFSHSYIEKEFFSFAPHDEALVIEGYLPDGRLDAAAIIMHYGSMACYRHGASRGLDKRLPASYLVQWAAILEAKRRGLRWYNFWGVAPEEASRRHPFFGITHFKTGFGGRTLGLLPCHDLPLSPRYGIIWCVETMRRLYRGFG